MWRQVATGGVVVWAIFAPLLCAISVVDVCTTAKYIGNPRRSASYVLDLKDTPVCDADIQSGIWYTFGNDKMPESCVEMYKCGSEAPIWLNGNHPTADNPGPVERVICAQQEAKGPCCQFTNKINVRWCQNATSKQEYFVYQLIKPPVCKLSYCAGPAGTNLKCKDNCAWNDITSSCSCPKFPVTTPPVLEEPIITSVKNVTDTRGRPFNATRFGIKCRIGYPHQVKNDGARFLVVLESNGIEIARANATVPFVYFDEDLLRHKLETHITCRVTSYWSSSDPKYSESQVSNALWLGLQAVKENGEVIKNPVIKDGEVFAFRIVANFPITSLKCFDKPPDVPCHALYIFQISASKAGRLCACRFALSPAKNSTDLITVSPAPIIGSRTKPFLWEIAFVNRTNENDNLGSIFEGYTIPSIKVQIEDSGTRPLCSSTGDPHITTFPTGPSNTRLLYNLYMSGDFLIVNAKTRLFQIQVRQFICQNNVACNCGVMIREGNNILGIDSCKRGEGAEADWSPRLIRYLNDPDSPSGEIEPTGSGWTVRMLSGFKINVDKGYTGGVLDLHFIALQGETYDGLCSYSGKQVENCKSDCEIYRIPEGESFFNYNSSNTPKCKEPYIVPTCDCHRSEDDDSINVTCSQPNQSNLLRTSFKCEQTPNTINPSIPKPPTSVNETDHISVEVINPNNKPIDTNGGNVVLVWPTPVNKINETYAKEACTAALTNSEVYKICSKAVDAESRFIIDGCVRDIQLTDDLGPVRSIQGQLQSICIYQKGCGVIEGNNGPVNSSVVLINDLDHIRSNICPNQCSNRGKCVNSSCICDPDYIGADCLLKKGYVPAIKYLVEPVCTFSTDKNCAKIYIQTTDVLSGYSVSCKIKKAAESVKLDTSPVVSGGVIICSLSSDISPGTYMVSISIDGQTYSTESEYIIRPSGPSPISNAVTARTPRTTPKVVKTTPLVLRTTPKPLTAPNPFQNTTPGSVPCPHLVVLWDDLRQCTSNLIAKAVTIHMKSNGNAQCQDVGVISDAFQQCTTAIFAKAKAGRK